MSSSNNANNFRITIAVYVTNKNERGSQIPCARVKQLQSPGLCCDLFDILVKSTKRLDLMNIW